MNQSPSVFYRTLLPLGTLPCFPHSNSQSCKPRLTAYCPWMTAWSFFLSILGANSHLTTKFPLGHHSSWTSRANWSHVWRFHPKKLSVIKICFHLFFPISGANSHLTTRCPVGHHSVWTSRANWSHFWRFHPRKSSHFGWKNQKNPKAVWQWDQHTKRTRPSDCLLAAKSKVSVELGICLFGNDTNTAKGRN